MFLLAALILAVFGCRTLNQTIDESLTPAEFFQRAQEASDASDYRLAMRYYETFQRIHPEDLQRNLWASYEIAFLYHKMGDDRKAVELFDELLERYRTAGSDDWPAGPRILAEKVKAEIQPKGAPPSPAQPPQPPSTETPPVQPAPPETGPPDINPPPPAGPQTEPEIPAP